jgi:hypothetical protein
VSQRDIWNGQPGRLPYGFRLTKPHANGLAVAVCEVWTHPDGWELRLAIDRHGVPIETVLPWPDTALALVETWRTSMLQKGWT